MSLRTSLDNQSAAAAAAERRTETHYNMFSMKNDQITRGKYEIYPCKNGILIEILLLKEFVKLHN